MLLILLSEIGSYTLKIGDLSGDLAVLPLSRYHCYRAYYAVSIFTIVILLHPYSHVNIVVYLLHTTSFVTLEEVKISYSKGTVILLLDG